MARATCPVAIPDGLHAAARIGEIFQGQAPGMSKHPVPDEVSAVIVHDAVFRFHPGTSFQRIPCPALVT